MSFYIKAPHYYFKLIFHAYENLTNKEHGLVEEDFLLAPILQLD